tara:strand:+ start:9498 stop:10115 length:618 start_codon:yes stop_codon:yes gene_type:complete
MNLGRRTSRIIQTGLILSALVASILGTYSLRAPSNKGQDVLTRQELQYGRPRRIITPNYQTKIQDYAFMQIYAASTIDFTKENSTIPVYPTAYEGFEHDVTLTHSIHRKRDGSRKAAPDLQAGKDYFLQWQLPQPPAEQKIVYDGQLLTPNYWVDPETNILMARVKITPKLTGPGEKPTELDVYFKTPSKGTFYFKLPVRGIQPK